MDLTTKIKIFILPLNVINYITKFRRYHYLKAGLHFFYSPCIEESLHYLWVLYFINNIQYLYQNSFKRGNIHEI